MLSQAINNKHMTLSNPLSVKAFSVTYKMKLLSKYV